MLLLAIASVALINVAMVALGSILLLRRSPPHHCRQCGYDTQASSLRCPECGSSLSPAGDRTGPGAHDRRLSGAIIIGATILADIGFAVYFFRFLTL